MNLWCLLRLHCWTKWAEVSRADLKRQDAVVGRCFIQERFCWKCGLAQRCADTVWVGSPPADEKSTFERAWGCKLNEW